MDRLKLADELEKGIADPDSTPDEVGEHVRMHLPTILSALRDAGTGRDSGEAMREAAAKCADAWRMNGAAIAPLFGMTLNETAIASKAADGIAAAIRALPLQTGSDGHE